MPVVVLKTPSSIKQHDFHSLPQFIPIRHRDCGPRRGLVQESLALVSNQVKRSGTFFPENHSHYGEEGQKDRSALIQTTSLRWWALPHSSSSECSMITTNTIIVQPRTQCYTDGGDYQEAQRRQLTLNRTLQRLCLQLTNLAKNFWSTKPSNSRQALATGEYGTVSCSCTFAPMPIHLQKVFQLDSGNVRIANPQVASRAIFAG